LSFVFDIFGAGAKFKASREEAKAHTISAERAAASAEAEAKQLETRARQGLAVGSYNSERVTKRASEIMATQRARAAAGGGDTTDLTVQSITDETIREAAMESLLTMAEAEDHAKQDRYAAAVTRVTGKQQADAYKKQASAAKLAGTAQLMGDLSNMWSKYSGGGGSSGSISSGGYTSTYKIS
jgi:hypothetical protein